MKTKICSVGECMIEIANTKNNIFQQSFAGDTLNFCNYIDKKYFDVSFLTAIGKTSVNRSVLEFINSKKISTKLIKQVNSHEIGLYLINNKNNEINQYNYSNFETRIIISSNSDSDNNDDTNILNNISTINNTNVYSENKENIENCGNSKTNENNEINCIPNELKNKDALCSICLEEYSNTNSNIIQLECQHYYHLDCFIQWVIKQKYEIIKRLEQNNHNLKEEDIYIYCPECKKKFPKIMKLY